MTAQLRAATAHDLDAIVTVFLACWRENYVGVLPNEAVSGMSDARAAALWSSVFAEEKTSVVVAESNGAVLGVTRFSLESETVGTVHSLYVSPLAQGLGLGTQLLAAAYSTLRAQGVQSCTLWVFEANTPSIEFYSARGWLPDGESRVQDDFGATELRLRYELEVAS